MLEPSLTILDETDSGLDVDAVHTVSAGIEAYRRKCGGKSSDHHAQHEDSGIADGGSDPHHGGR